MAEHNKPWFLRTPTRWTHFRSLPLRHLSVLMVAVFFLFSVIGYYVDLINKGELPYLVVFAVAIFSGLNAVLWIVVLARLSRIFLIALIVLQFFVGEINTAIANALIRVFNLQLVASQSGIDFAATAILCTVILSYIFFTAFIRRQGLESFRMANELALAHGIQKTLVPPVMLRTAAWDIYGISCPSEQVGGDLVDAIRLTSGDAIAYLADIAGHGLQSGILMGMLKTAARTALLEAGEREPASTLPVLLDRLNTVLPMVKEAHMYATFTGLRLGADGTVHYALAASPPLLHWHAGQRSLSNTEQEQFPLGLLPVPSFDGATLSTAPGDLLVVATDGILEVASKSGPNANEEYGVDRLKSVIERSAADPLPVIAEKILAAARSFGPSSTTRPSSSSAASSPSLRSQPHSLYPVSVPPRAAHDQVECRPAGTDW